MVSGLSTNEFPSNEFKVIPVKGLSINAHIDPRSEEVGYLCLMGARVCSRKTTSLGLEKPLTIIIELLFKIIEG